MRKPSRSSRPRASSSGSATSALSSWSLPSRTGALSLWSPPPRPPSLHASTTGPAGPRLSWLQPSASLWPPCAARLPCGSTRWGQLATPLLPLPSHLARSVLEVYFSP
eukprot:jgi/Mesen1/6154/ME000314S05155